MFPEIKQVKLQKLPLNHYHHRRCTHFHHQLLNNVLSNTFLYRPFAFFHPLVPVEITFNRPLTRSLLPGSPKKPRAYGNDSIPSKRNLWGLLPLRNNLNPSRIIIPSNQLPTTMTTFMHNIRPQSNDRNPKGAAKETQKKVRQEPIELA
jgi:hypothetical protein